MEWSKAESDIAIIGRPTGKIDEASWQAFSGLLTEAVQHATSVRKPLIIDLAGVDYMSSRGLRALTLARREAGDAVTISLAAPNDRMREILAISRYDRIFPILDAADPSS